ncbi:MAG: hypothetical protein ACI9U6_003184, partial [Loktanella salsilacus]
HKGRPAWPRGCSFSDVACHGLFSAGQATVILQFMLAA